MSASKGVRLHGLKTQIHRYLRLVMLFHSMGCRLHMFWSWTAHGNTSGKNSIHVTEQSAIDFFQAPEENLHG